MELKLSKPREKWFYLLVLPMAIAIEWAFAASLDWSAYPRSEWVALFDLCIFLPFIYLFFFSSTLQPKAKFIRAAGVSGLGLFAASFIVPESNQFALGELSKLRNAMLIVIIVFEVFVFWKLITAVFDTKTDEHKLERDFAVPAWAARLMLLEARFWKAVWKILRRK